MTINKIDIESDRITSFACPWKVLGVPWKVRGGASEGPLGVIGGSLGVLGGLRGFLGILVNVTEECYKGDTSDHPMMME